MYESRLEERRDAVAEPVPKMTVSGEGAVSFGKAASETALALFWNISDSIIGFIKVLKTGLARVKTKSMWVINRREANREKPKRGG